MIHVADKNHRGRYNNAKTGVFLMQHPEKFCGQEQPVYKSELERLFMKYADSNPSVVQWGYETCYIKYLDKSSNPPKIRRYFIDFVCKIKIGTTFKTVWIEIKPHSETVPPKKNANPQSLLTWIKNQSKWEAARLLAKSKNYEFHILTEEQLH